MTSEIIVKDDTGNRINRGFPAYRSDMPTNLTGYDYLKYKVKVDKNGLKIADGQEFFFQSSIGPNH